MISLQKLEKLSPRHRLRKSLLVLGELERRALREGGEGRSVLESTSRAILALAEFLAADSLAPDEIRKAAKDLVDPPGLAADPFLRGLNKLRHTLIAATGQAPADWDLLDPRTGFPDPGARRIRAGLRVYLEDIRSPFNVGTIFRTAEAFGVESILLSPQAADPGHPRARRSAMGAVDLVPWSRGSLEAPAGEGAVFALELGGRALSDFEFPLHGTVVLGSEELGVSPEALSLCGLGKVSIPMSGAKASLNVAVAFGILIHAWSAFLDCREDPAG
jgi:TrmH family RNA methyltransferase